MYGRISDLAAMLVLYSGRYPLNIADVVLGSYGMGFGFGIFEISS